MRNIVLLTLTVVSVTLVISVPSTAADQDELTYLNYGISADSERQGPLPTRERHVITYVYFARGAEQSRSNVLAKESFYKDTRTALELFRHGKKHGIQREWFRNGKIKAESPYKNGVMHGMFKRWSETGDLIAQYRIVNGTGTMRIYQSNGYLDTEPEIKDSRRNGRSIVFFPNQRARSITWFKNDMPAGKGWAFYEDGSPYLIAWSQGPSIYFDQKGLPSRKLWRVNDREITESEYIKLAAADASLPPYYEDASRYKEFVDESINAIIEKYRKLPRVKIPLEFGEKGEPLLAER